MMGLMQKLTKKQLAIYSLLISGLIYLMVQVLWGVGSLLRSNSYASVVLYLLFAVLAGLVGRILLHRKVAAVAAGSTAILLLGIYKQALHTK